MNASSPQRFPSFADILTEHRRSMPDRTALVCGGHRAGWAATDDRVGRVAAAMASSGVGAGDRVLWLGQNCHRQLESLLACARLGAVWCPVDGRLSRDRLAFLVEDSDPALIFWHAAGIGAAVDDLRSTTSATWVRADGPDGDVEYERMLAETAPGAHWPEVDAGEPAVMLYPGEHGALLSHRAWVLQNLVTAWAQRTGATDVFLCSGPLCHVDTLRHALSTFQLGGCTVVAPTTDAALLCELIERERCTGALLGPPLIEELVEVNGKSRYDLSSLRAAPGRPEWNAMVTTEVLPLRDGFGRAELAGVVTFAGTATPGIGPAGRPSPIAVVDVLDPADRPAPAGEVGELVVRGPMVMNGYHRRPEQRRGRWHHTGEHARREVDGTLTVVPA